MLLLEGTMDGGTVARWVRREPKFKEDIDGVRRVLVVFWTIFWKLPSLF